VCSGNHGAGFARNPIYTPAELASVERGSSPAISRNRYLATIAACPQGVVIPLITARTASTQKARQPPYLVAQRYFVINRSQYKHEAQASE